MLILATDGLWDVMKPADAVAVVKRVLEHGGSVQLKAEALGDAATSLARTAAQVCLAAAGPGSLSRARCGFKMLLDASDGSYVVL